MTSTTQSTNPHLSAQLSTEQLAQLATLEPLNSDSYRCCIDTGGEVVYEMIPGQDGLGWGMMVADITQGTPHYHRHTTEIYVVVTGTLELQLNDEKRTAEAGEVITVPSGVVHCGRSLGDGPCRVVGFTFPAWSPEDHLPTK